MTHGDVTVGDQVRVFHDVNKLEGLDWIRQGGIGVVVGISEDPKGPYFTVLMKKSRQSRYLRREHFRKS